MRIFSILCIAFFLFLFCERVESSTTLRDSPIFSMRRLFVWSSISVKRVMASSASTRVFDLFACCPPGPPEGLKLQTISETGMRRFGFMKR